MAAHRENTKLDSTVTRPPPYSDKDHRRSLQREFTEKGETSEPPLELIIMSRCSKFRQCKYCIYFLGGLLAFLACAVIIVSLFPYPVHASCVVKWKFGEPCTPVMQKFRRQILNWSSCMNCGPRGSRCLYSLKEPSRVENNVIRATHVGVNMKPIETMRIAFEETNKTCVATGESVSNEWFRIFDYGANYCNLHNLVVGAGFDRSYKFLELTTNAICTQYTMTVCQ